MGGDARYGVVGLLWGEFFDTFGGSACVYAMAFGGFATCEDGACGYYGVGLDSSAVEDYGAHADEDTVGDFGAVDYGGVAYGDVVADYGVVTLVGAVDDGVILHIDAVAETYGSDIATEYCAEPHATTIAHSDIAYDGGGWGDVAVLANDWLLVAECDDICHEGLLFFVDGMVGEDWFLATYGAEYLRGHEGFAL